MIRKIATSRKGGSVALGKDVRVSYSIADMHDELLYVWVTLKDGRDMQVFFNRETNLLVVDVNEGTRFGTELVRRNLPPAMTSEERSDLARKFKNQKRREDREEAKREKEGCEKLGEHLMNLP